MSTASPASRVVPHEQRPGAPTLGELIDRAALAYRRNDYRGSEAEMDRKEAAWEDAHADLTRHLRETLGLTPDQLNELGGLI